MGLQRNIASFLGTEASILHSQGLSTIPSVIFAFSKCVGTSLSPTVVSMLLFRRAYNFRAPPFAGSSIMTSEVLLRVEKERRKCGGLFTRIFVVTEDIFEKDGAMVYLPKLLSCSHDTRHAG